LKICCGEKSVPHESFFAPHEIQKPSSLELSCRPGQLPDAIYCMTELGDIFAELGISHYLHDFLEQGFDTWETILDITESDFDALGVKLGHRRKLQRKIANSRGLSSDRALASPRNTPTDDRQPEESKGSNPKTESKDGSGASQGAKRKYRRHPKPDENAPERPPSAYVVTDHSFFFCESRLTVAHLDLLSRTISSSPESPPVVSDDLSVVSAFTTPNSQSATFCIDSTPIQTNSQPVDLSSPSDYSTIYVPILLEYSVNRHRSQLFRTP
jgi:hypothetical protein